MTINNNSNPILLLFFLSFFMIFEISGQVSEKYPSLKENKDISWIGETEFIYQLENHDRMTFTPTSSNQEETRVIKIDPIATCNYGSERFLTNYLLVYAQEGKLKSFSEDGRLLSINEVSNMFSGGSLDTITTIDPETFEETFAIVRTDPMFNIGSFKIKQWWYYNKKNGSFNSTVKSIGPMSDVYDKEGYVVNSKFLFWIDVEQPHNQEFNFNQPNIIWAKETINTLSFENVKKIKGSTRKTFKNLTFQNPKKGKSQVLENESWYSYCSPTIPTDELNQMLSASKDTIITYDPETYEETIEIAKKSKTKYKDFKNYRVHQHWYFDKAQNKLASKLIAIAPLFEVKDEKGKLRYRRALYYIPANPEQE